MGSKLVLRRRRRLFRRVMSLHVDGTPVTQPSNVPKETYHIVEISVDGRVFLELLFRQSDGYLITFRLVKNVQNLLVWEGWFHFSDRDIILPDFFGERISLGWDCGYVRVKEASICRHTMSSLVTCLLDFKQSNCTRKSFGDYGRVIVFETWMVLLGECQRSGVFLDFVERHHNSEEPYDVGYELCDHLHSWSNFSKIILHIHLALLMRQYGERGWEKELEEAERQLTSTILALSKFGHSIMKRFIVYKVLPDGSPTDRPDGERSLPSLLGTEVGQLLHLIKCDTEHVQNIHKLMKKHCRYWPDAGTESDSEPEPEL